METILTDHKRAGCLQKQLLWEGVAAQRQRRGRYQPRYYEEHQRSGAPDARRRHRGLAAAHFHLPEGTRALFIHEAGRDGFWLPRLLRAMEHEVVVIDAGSVEKPRRKRAKTDFKDAEQMLRLADRLLFGNTKACSVVKVPPEDVEDERHVTRSLTWLVEDVVRMKNRIGSALALHGIKHEVKGLRETLDTLEGPGGVKPGPNALNEIEAMLDILDALCRKIAELHRELTKQAREALAEQAPGVKWPSYVLYINTPHRPVLGEDAEAKARRKEGERRTLPWPCLPQGQCPGLHTGRNL